MKKNRNFRGGLNMLPWVFGIALLIASSSFLLFADTVEFLNGQKYDGKVISETDTEIVFEAEMDGASIKMKVAKDKIHSLTIGREKRIINEKGGGAKSIKRSKPAKKKTKRAKKKTKGAGEGWAVFGGDASRSFSGTVSLPDELSLRWVFKPRLEPRVAWPGTDTRMGFDKTFHTVAANGMVVFGSSADCKIYALDAENGNVLWTYFTDGPVRFAPCLYKEYVYAVSDDGYLYCLSANDGTLVWKKRGGPNDEKVLGNDRLISRWPARGGLVIADNTVYFGAGIWPSEGVYIYALDPSKGNVKWVNDSSGTLVLEQPHSGNKSKSGISAQGYFAVSDGNLFVPTGRGVPAVLDSKTGKYKYFHLAANQSSGGSRVITGKSFFINSTYLFNSADGKKLGTQRYYGDLAAVSDESIITWYKGKLLAFPITGEKGEVWSLSCPSGGSSLIKAGDLVLSGGKGAVGVADKKTNKIKTSLKIEGEALGISAADNNLYVNNEKGWIYCFGKGGSSKGRVVEQKVSENVYSNSRLYSKAAEEILKQTGITKGYCVDLGAGDGALSYWLAKNSELTIIALEKDKEQAALAREKLDEAGLYGARVTVICCDPAKNTLPASFANLVVSGSTVKTGGKLKKGIALRLLSPYRGIAMYGKSGSMKKIESTVLPNAGEWTHQYADAANTSCSDDGIVKGPLQMLWFTDFCFQMPSRHGRGPSPLFKNGVMVVEGMNGLLGVDACNGTKLWEYTSVNILKKYDQEHLLGTAGTHGNMCIGEEFLFLNTGSSCVRLDLHTGEKTAEFNLPGQKAGSGKWGYIACENGTLYGTQASEKYVAQWLYRKSDMKDLMTTSGMLFALDVKTGKTKWVYNAVSSVRHNAIAIGDGKVYLIDNSVSDGDRLENKAAKGKAAVNDPSPGGRLLCLDSRTGKKLWEKTEDIFGTTLVLSTKYNILVMGYQYSQRAFQLPSEKGNRLVGLSSTGGRKLWNADDKYISRPLINDKVLFTQPHARDILTGKARLDLKIKGRQPGGCGTISGSAYLLLFRSGVLGYVDLIRKTATENYGGIRPGCWINAIPAGGLVLMPDATDRCKCSYLIKASIGLQAP